MVFVANRCEDVDQRDLNLQRLLLLRDLLLILLVADGLRQGARSRRRRVRVGPV